MEGDRRYIRCVPFTRTKRLAPTIGDFFGWTKWPFPMTVFQFTSFVVVALGMLLAIPLWAHFGIANFLIYAGAVVGSKYATRQVRIEGRAPWAAGLGLVGSLTGRPRVNGVAYKAQTVTRYKASKMLLVPDDSWRCYPFAIVTPKHAAGWPKSRLRRNYWQRRAS